MKTAPWICMLTVTTLASLTLSSAFAEDGAVPGAHKDRVAPAKAKATHAREGREARIEERKKDVAGAKEARENRAAEAKEARADKQAEAAKKREATVDKREANQAKRIQHGISKGYLTADESNQLKAQQESIAALESSFKDDHKLTKAERKTLEEALNEASRMIWAEKHDTDGNQMATYRLGKNVYAKSAMTSQMANENLSGADAKALLKTFRRTVELKRTLSNADLSAEERAKLQTEYDELLNQNFEIR